MKLTVITGLSGAGKTSAAACFEDMGYYCVDNMPASLIPDFAEVMASKGTCKHMAVVTDIRSGAMLEGLGDAAARITSMGIECEILFLEAEERVIAQRYDETGRMHPLIMQTSSLERAIAEEAARLAPVRRMADYIIDSSAMKPAELKKEILRLFSSEKFPAVTVLPAVGADKKCRAAVSFDLNGVDLNDKNLLEKLLESAFSAVELYMQVTEREISVLFLHGNGAEAEKAANAFAGRLARCKITAAVSREYL